MLAINHSRLSADAKSTKSYILIIYLTDVYNGVISQSGFEERLVLACGLNPTDHYSRP